MIFLIARRYYGIRGQEFFGMVKGIVTHSFFIRRLFRGERKIQLVASGMSMETGVIQMRALQQRLFLTLRCCLLPPTLAEFQKSLIQSLPE